MIFCRAFFTCSTSIWADIAVIVHYNRKSELPKGNETKHSCIMIYEWGDATDCTPSKHINQIKKKNLAWSLRLPTDMYGRWKTEWCKGWTAMVAHFAASQAESGIQWNNQIPSRWPPWSTCILLLWCYPIRWQLLYYLWYVEHGAGGWLPEAALVDGPQAAYDPEEGALPAPVGPTDQQVHPGPDCQALKGTICKCTLMSFGNFFHYI